mmetsp:Transcript_17710/g.26525  ORF Transcript_17710/g.26525 Transcript_17710/m.26525 type:complete len:137 (-) Transcript_17710:226-636(-)
MSKETKTRERELIKKAKSVMPNAGCKHSGYQVGCALLTSCGAMIAGVNIESDSYGLTICAERICLGNALTAGKKDFVLMAIATKNGGSSCGACRQLMAEYCPKDMPVIFCNEKEEVTGRTTIAELLPNAFVLSPVK